MSDENHKVACSKVSSSMMLNWFSVEQTRAHYHSSYTWTWLFVSDVPATDWQDTIVFGDKAVILDYSDAADRLANFTEVYS